MPPTAFEVFFGPTNRVVTLKLIRYSLVMLLLPLSTFYFLFYFVFEKDNKMLGWCGIAAVIAANLVIASYVMMAWAEDRQDFAQKKVNHKALNSPDRIKESLEAVAFTFFPITANAPEFSVGTEESLRTCHTARMRMPHRRFITEEINECETMNPNIKRIQTFRSGQKGTVKPGRNGAGSRTSLIASKVIIIISFILQHILISILEVY